MHAWLCPTEARFVVLVLEQGLHFKSNLRIHDVEGDEFVEIAPQEFPEQHEQNSQLGHDVCSGCEAGSCLRPKDLCITQR